MKLGCTVAHVLGKEKTIDKVDTITLRLTCFTSTTLRRPAGGRARRARSEPVALLAS